MGPTVKDGLLIEVLRVAEGAGRGCGQSEIPREEQQGPGRTERPIQGLARCIGGFRGRRREPCVRISEDSESHSGDRDARQSALRGLL